MAGTANGRVRGRPPYSQWARLPPTSSGYPAHLCRRVAGTLSVHSLPVRCSRAHVQSPPSLDAWRAVPYRELSQANRGERFTNSGKLHLGLTWFSAAGQSQPGHVLGTPRTRITEAAPGLAGFDQISAISGRRVVIRRSSCRRPLSPVPGYDGQSTVYFIHRRA
jgi:hypothetical protein